MTGYTTVEWPRASQLHWAVCIFVVSNVRTLQKNPRQQGFSQTPYWSLKNSWVFPSTLETEEFKAEFAGICIEFLRFDAAQTKAMAKTSRSAGTTFGDYLAQVLLWQAIFSLVIVFFVKTAGPWLPGVFHVVKITVNMTKFVPQNSLSRWCFF